MSHDVLCTCVFSADVAQNVHMSWLRYAILMNFQLSQRQRCKRSKAGASRRRNVEDVTIKKVE
jgi:hypothetical protein